MTPTVDVDPDVYHAASQVVGQAVANQLTDTATGLHGSLANSGGMAGTDPGGVNWADAYDPAASATTDALADLANGCYRVAALLKATGFNHAAANAASDPSRTAPAPPDTTNYDHSVRPGPAPPSAHGGTGDTPKGWSLIEHVVGYVWPNGDPDKLRSAATAWSKAADTLYTASFDIPEAIEAVRSQKSPEVDGAVTVCESLMGHIQDSADTCRSLSATCNDLAQHIDQAHKGVENELVDLLKWTAIIEGGGIVVGIFTAGIGEGAAQGVEAGRIAATGARVASIIKRFISTAATVTTRVRNVASKIAEIAARLKPILRAKPIQSATEETKTLTETAKAEETALPTGGKRLQNIDPEVQEKVDNTIARAKEGKPTFPGHDGKPFDDEDGKLPPAPYKDYYQEWTVANSGEKRGLHRIIIGGDPKNPDFIYYWDHYKTYTRIYP